VTTGDDPLRQREARPYARERRRREAAGAVVSVGVLTIGALAGDRIADALDTPGPLVVDAGLWLLVAGLAWELAHLPLAVAGWRAARAAGISRQRAPGWIADQLKAMAIGFVLGWPALTALVWAQREWPDGWWLAAAAGAALVELALTLLGPVVILPIFMRSHALAPGPLSDDLYALARRAGVRVASVRVLEAGVKTSGQNAFVAGIGPSRRIMLFDTLAERDGGVDRARMGETRAVLAHELGHARRHDVWRLVALGAAGGLVTFGLAAALLSVLPQALAHGGAGDLAALPALGLCLFVCGEPVRTLACAYSRRRERAADGFAVALEPGEAFARALEALVAANLAELRPPRAYELLRMTHPAPASRIAAARARDARTRVKENSRAAANIPP